MSIITNRRILHQPFFPDTSSSTSSSSPPFFPSYDSPPPPPTLTQPLTPPSPLAFASFPANVSSLDTPRSPESGNSVSPSLLAVTIVSVLLAVFIVSIALYYYCKRRDKHLCEGSDTKTYSRSDNNSRRLYPISATGNVVVTATTHVESGFDDDDDGVRKVRSNSSTRPTSTEFLYLGTIASSGLIGDCGGRGSADLSSGDIGGGGGDLAERKLDSSPVLRPLPPLARYGGNNGSVGFPGEEEDEFYSPNGSYYSVGGSGSGRVFAAVAAAAVVEMVGMRSETSTSSCSSSNLGSPIRFKTDSVDSPASLDHHRSSPSLSSSPSPPTDSLPGRRGVYATQPQPPPPPPPPPLAARNMESRTPSPPSILRPVSKPPGLIISPPKPTPIVFQSPTRVSPATLVAEKSEDETTKPKLKPLHWDKVGASSDREMVWDQLKSSSFKLNEEMIESLFVAKTSNSSAKETARGSVVPSPVQDRNNRILDPKKSQNIAISLRALNVTAEEVCEALLEGNADTLGAELLESLLKMAPSKEEERKLKEFKDDSPFKLGPAERFLKEVLGIPFAFQRIDVMLYMANFESEVEYLKSSFTTLEAACEELRNSRIFFKLLEAVLKTGNRMNVGTNRGDAHAFKLDTLLKLVDVKAADGKTTLLHFVVQEIIKSEGARLSDSYNQVSSAPTLNEDARCRKLGLQVVSNLRSELTNVKKAAAMDSTVLAGEVVKLSNGIENIKGVVMTLIGEGNVEFSESANKFVNTGEEEIIRVQAQESVSLSLVKEITEYFHGNSAKEEAHPFRIFMVVRDFLAVLDRVCKDVGTINDRTIVSSAHKFPVPVNPTIQHSLPGTH